MTRNQIHAATALGIPLLIAVAAVVAPPVPPASAQSQAARICREQTVRQGSDVYEYCLSQATRALEWGEPGLAHRFAAVAAQSEAACLSYGLAPASDGLRACLEKETRAREMLVYADEPPRYGPQVAGQ